VRDRLLLLDPLFEDPALPGRQFYCRDCMTLDGLLVTYPDKAATLDVIRIAWPRPRAVVVAAIGEANQNLPVLLLADDAPAELADGEYEGTRFVGDFKRLLHALYVRHGFPEAHP
jgi:hypothetical protein